MRNIGWISLTERKPDEKDGDMLVWHRYQGTMAVTRAQYLDNRFFTHWREMPADGWTDVRERLPGAGDADVWGCVLTKHRYNGIRVTGWRQLALDKDYTAWRRAPEPPGNT